MLSENVKTSSPVFISSEKSSRLGLTRSGVNTRTGTALLSSVAISSLLNASIAAPADTSIYVSKELVATLVRLFRMFKSVLVRSIIKTGG